MVVFLRLRRLNRNCARLCSTLILGTLLCESCFVSWMKVLVDIMSFTYWSFISQLELGSERYRFSKVDHQMVVYEGRNQYRMNQIEVIWAFYDPHNTPHNIKPFVTHLRGINHSIIHFRRITLSIIYFRNIRGVYIFSQVFYFNFQPSVLLTQVSDLFISHKQD